MILAILQARMSSKRLPGKVMAPVLGEPMVGRQIERLQLSRRIERLVLATSVDPSDDPLAAYVQGLGVEVFRGSLEDVLDRYWKAASAHSGARVIVRVTADCPLTDPALIDKVIAHHEDTGADYTTAALHARTYPHGLDVEAIRPDALEEAAWRANDPYEREHVTPYIYRRPDRFRLAGVARQTSLAHLRWTVDVPEDLVFVRDVYAKLYPFNPEFTSDDIIGLPVNSAPIPP